MSATTARTADRTRSTSVEPIEGAPIAAEMPSSTTTMISSTSVYACRKGRRRNGGSLLALAVELLDELGGELHGGHVLDADIHAAVELGLDPVEPRVHGAELGDHDLALLEGVAESPLGGLGLRLRIGARGLECRTGVA